MNIWIQHKIQITNSILVKSKQKFLKINKNVLAFDKLIYVLVFFIQILKLLSICQQFLYKHKQPFQYPMSDTFSQNYQIQLIDHFLTFDDPVACDELFFEDEYMLDNETQRGQEYIDFQSQTQHYSIKEQSHSNEIDQCSDSSADRNRSKKSHLEKNRRKKNQRQQTDFLFRLVKKYDQDYGNTGNQEQKKILSQQIKNLLAFAKKAHFGLILKKMGSAFLQNYDWINQIYEKDGMTSEDYHRLYTFGPLEQAFKLFFKQKMLYRQLMVSRVVPKNKIFYLYFADVFQRNFKNRCFEGISCVKIEIEKQKLKNKNI